MNSSAIAGPEDQNCDGYFGINPKLTKNLNLENNHLKNQSYEHASTQDHEEYY